MSASNRTIGFLQTKSQGFTLVELMVVVGIIGLLTAIALPNFVKYQGKAKTSEAKLQLAALYMAEQSFYMDYENYGTCLSVMGYSITAAEQPNHYYAMGFDSAADTASSAGGGPNDAAVKNGASGTCLVVDPDPATGHQFQYDAGKKVGSATAAVAEEALTAGAFGTTATSVGADGQTFLGGAAGLITNTGSGLHDQWTINESKEIRPVQVGY